MHAAVLCSAEGLRWGQRTDCEGVTRHRGVLQAVLRSTRTCKATTMQICAACDADAQVWAALVCLELQSASASSALSILTSPAKPGTRLLWQPASAAGACCVGS